MDIINFHHAPANDVSIIRVRADDYRQTIDGVVNAISSLRSCLDSEVYNEARILVNSMFRLITCRPLRRNPVLEDRALGALARAKDAMEQARARLARTAARPA